MLQGSREWKPYHRHVEGHDKSPMLEGLGGGGGGGGLAKRGNVCLVKQDLNW
ncbi:hypothetical protein Lalb_Chr09g0329651 [Lupinus albus]|uniref:Uncharacterized protein n=1 Tax=Lupinus albus TaxID=3870 RepID=A0A6A4Q022_LUPAL|nr:hypothetical protein Lalb_Chr09g0329651 [Lupinus albus]